MTFLLLYLCGLLCVLSFGVLITLFSLMREIRRANRLEAEPVAQASADLSPEAIWENHSSVITAEPTPEQRPGAFKQRMMRQDTVFNAARELVRCHATTSTASAEYKRAFETLCKAVGDYEALP